MLIVLYYLFLILFCVLDIYFYSKLVKENKRLKKELLNKYVNGTELELQRLRYLIKYYANRDKKGF